MNKSLHVIAKYLLYIIGIILIVMSIKEYNSESACFGEYYYNYSPRKFVGGDAYNYMIAAINDNTEMTKALLLAIYGCTSLIVGKMIRIR